MAILKEKIAFPLKSIRNLNMYGLFTQKMLKKAKKPTYARTSENKPYKISITDGKKLGF